MSDGGKGSGSRPMDVPRAVYGENHDRIWPPKQRQQYVPPPLPVDARVEQIREEIREGIIWSLTYDPRKEPPPLPDQEPPRVRRGLNELSTVTPDEFQDTIWVIGEPKPKEPPCPAD